MSAARCDMLPRILSLSSALAPLRASAHCELSTVLAAPSGCPCRRTCCHVLEDEHQAADLFDQLGLVDRQVLQQGPLGRRGRRRSASRRRDSTPPARAETLAHHARSSGSSRPRSTSRMISGLVCPIVAIRLTTASCRSESAARPAPRRRTWRAGATRSGRSSGGARPSDVRQHVLAVDRSAGSRRAGPRSTGGCCRSPRLVVSLPRAFFTRFFASSSPPPLAAGRRGSSRRIPG